MEDKKQLKVLITVETDQRFKRVSTILGPVSPLLDHIAGIEENMLARLPPADRGPYLLGQLSCKAFVRSGDMLRRASCPSAHKRRPRSPGSPVAQLNTLVRASTREKLKRYCRFYGIPLWDFLDRWSRRLERLALARIPPERHAEYYAGTLRAVDLLGVEIEDAPDDTAAPSIAPAAHNNVSQA